MKNLDYLEKSYNNNLKNPVGDFRIHGIRVYVKEPVNEKINLHNCLTDAFGKIPKIFLRNIHSLYIGNFPFLKKRNVDAIYKQGVIYMTNDQENELDILSDIVHEISHSFEEGNGQEIYEDGEIMHEFLAKREQLYFLLNSNRLITGNIDYEDFKKTEYCEKLDNYLYKDVGYEKIRNIAGNLFVSPYGATCLREYFANCFENFFVNDMFTVKKISPSVFNKILNYLEF